MKKTIEDFDLNSKKVIIRVDFNVPMKDGKILDDNRIRCSLDTINYAINHNAKIILLSHLGRIKEEKDKLTNSLAPVAKRLGELLNKDVIFSPETTGSELEEKINNLNDGDVLLIENTRFEDLNGKRESGNDPLLGKYWATLADIFINDAFGTSHRLHASNVGIATYLPSGLGFLVKKELENLSIALNPVRPYTVILGGSKVSDKIGVIKNLVNKADYILIGGGMAYTFLNAIGKNIGESILDTENIEFCKDMLKQYSNKIILPVDTIVSNSKLDRIEKNVDNIDNDDKGLDIGKDTIKLFESYLDKSRTIVWNGPLGMFEDERYLNGTKSIAYYLTKLNSNVIIGGGDTANAVINLGYKNFYTHVSTGGGASLELLEGKILPGIDIISDN